MPRAPQHSVTVGLERVANWDCPAAGRHYGTLHPRKSYRRCSTAPEQTAPMVEQSPDLFDDDPLKSEKNQNPRIKPIARWTYIGVFGIALVSLIFGVSIAFVSPLFAQRAANVCADNEHARLAQAVRIDRERVARNLEQYRQTVAALQTELRTLRAAPPPDRRHQPDYASALLGGSIEATPLTEELPLRCPAHLLRPSDELGQCWGFRGERGVAVVRLAASVKVTHVAVVHLGASVAAPKEFDIAGLDDDLPFPLGSFRYDLNGPERQEFRVSANHGRAFQRLRFEVVGNHGHRSTCVYRLQVYGTAEGAPLQRPLLEP